MPRIAETPSGMLNSIGFQNVGLRRLVRDVCPVWATWDTPVIVNVLGDTVEEFATLARELDGAPGSTRWRSTSPARTSTWGASSSGRTQRWRRR